MRRPASVQQADPPGCWSGLAILAGSMVLSMTTWFSATAVVPQLRVEWGLGSGQAAGLTIAVQLGFVVGAVGSALLNIPDRFPPRRLILVGALGASAANLLVLTLSGPGPALILRGMTGMFLALVYPSAMKAMATWFRMKRGTALGVMVGALTLGSAAPHLVNGLGGLDWRAVIVTTSVLTALGGIVAEVFGRDGPYPFPRGNFQPRRTWQVVTDRSVVLASTGYLGHMWELYAMWAWFGVFFAHVLDQQAVPGAHRVAAVSTFAVIGTGALGCWVGGVLGDRWGRTKATSLAMALSGTCALLIGPLMHAPWPIVLAVGLAWGFWVIADSAQFSTVVTEVADQSYVGTALTLQLAAGFTLTVSTIWLIPFLAESIGWEWAFSVLALGPAAGVVAMLVLLRTPAAQRIAGGRG